MKYKVEPIKNICKECNKTRKYTIKDESERSFCDICWEDTLVLKLKSKYE